MHETGGSTPDGVKCDSWNCLTQGLTQNPTGLPSEATWPANTPAHHPGMGTVGSSCGWWKKDPFQPSGQGEPLYSDFMQPGAAQASYVSGDTIDVEWTIVANHWGVYSYRICTDGSDTEECFQQGILSTEKGEQWVELKQASGVVHDRVVLPADFTCERCTLSWRWDCRNSPQIWTGCADVMIKSSGNQPPSPRPSPTVHPQPPSPSPEPPPPRPSPQPVPQQHCAARWQQCGGQGFTGPASCCDKGYSCTEKNQWWYQCDQSTPDTPASTTMTPPTSNQSPEGGTATEPNDSSFQHGWLAWKTTIVMAVVALLITAAVVTLVVYFRKRHQRLEVPLYHQFNDQYR